jgi:hypothetical protein
MKLKLYVVEAERTRGAGCNPITKWRYKISTGSRCKGLISSHKYNCQVSAMAAGERMIIKLEGEG